MSAAVFSRGMSKWVNAIEPAAARAVGEYTNELYDALLDNTPVDTGFARSRWSLKFGASTIFNVDSSPPERDPDATYPRPPLPQTVFKRLQLIAITNDAPYIGALERGTASPKAPLGITTPARGSVEGLLEILLARYLPR